MRRLLLAVPLVALVAAAVDALLVRERLAHRPLDAALFLESVLLWLALALLAFLPVRWWLARRERSGRTVDGTRAATTLAFVTIAPVLIHARLDAFSDLGGGLAGLKSPRPWAETAGVLLVLVAVLAVLRWLAPRLREPRLAVALCVGALGLGLFSNPWHEREERATSSAAKKPNLLLLIWDTTRAQSLSFYGYDRATTPNLARLAAESTVFEHARSASRYTLTSHLSMLTGVYPSHHGARMTRQRISPRDTPSIAATLRERGYRTGAFVGTGVLSAPTGVAFGFDHFDDQVDPLVCDTLAWSLVHDLQSVVASFGPPFSQNGQPHWFQDFFRPAGQVLANATQWIENGDARPWFVMINLYDVHWPYCPDENARSKWVEPYDGPVDGFHFRSDHYPRGYDMQPRDDAHLRELYDAELSELDVKVDRFLGELDLAQSDTAVLMCSDHGEAFGEGGRYEHNDVLEPQVHIPFLVHAPRATESSARRVDAPVSGVDVAPTLLALAGVEAPKHFTGVDVQRIGEDPASALRTILVEDRDQMDPTDVRLALYGRPGPDSKVGTWKLVRRGLGPKQRFQLFDVDSDAVGVRDVAAEHPEIVERMRVELDEFRSRWHADDVKDQQDTTRSNVDALKALGYAGQQPDAHPRPLPGH